MTAVLLYPIAGFPATHPMVTGTVCGVSYFPLVGVGCHSWRSPLVIIKPSVRLGPAIIRCLELQEDMQAITISTPIIQSMPYPDPKHITLYSQPVEGAVPTGGG